MSPSREVNDAVGAAEPGRPAHQRPATADEVLEATLEKVRRWRAGILASGRRFLVLVPPSRDQVFVRMWRLARLTSLPSGGVPVGVEAFDLSDQVVPFWRRVLTARGLGHPVAPRACLAHAVPQLTWRESPDPEHVGCPPGVPFDVGAQWPFHGTVDLGGVAPPFGATAEQVHHARTRHLPTATKETT